MLFVAPFIPRGFHAVPVAEFFFASRRSLASKVRALRPLILPPVLGADELAYNFTVLSTLFAMLETLVPDPVVIVLESEASNQSVIPGNSVLASSSSSSL